MADESNLAFEQIFSDLLKKLQPEIRIRARQILMQMMRVLSTTPGEITKMVKARAGKNIRAEDLFVYLEKVWQTVRLFPFKEKNSSPSSDFPQIVSFIDKSSGKVHWTQIEMKKDAPVFFAGDIHGRNSNSPMIYSDSDTSQSDFGNIIENPNRGALKPLRTLIDNLSDTDTQDDHSSSESDMEALVPIKVVKPRAANKFLERVSTKPRVKSLARSDYSGAKNETTSEASDTDEDIILKPIKVRKTSQVQEKQRRIVRRRKVKRNGSSPPRQKVVCKTNTKYVRRAIERRATLTVIPTPSTITGIKKKPLTRAKSKKPLMAEEDRIKCLKCPTTFSSERARRRHFSEQHGKPKLYLCELCDFRCTLKRGLELHYKVTHCESPTFYDCPHCSMRYVRRSTLFKHIRDHHARLEG